VILHARVSVRPAVTEEVRELAADSGVQALDAAESEATIVARVSPRSRVDADDRVELAIDTRTLHFFDPRTGLGIYDAPTEGAPT